MGGPYCKTCKHFHKVPIYHEAGECTDPTKVIYRRSGDPMELAREVGEYFTCMNHESIPSAPALEPDGGNLYKPHNLMIHSGQFWRCAHGYTGFGESMKWVGCEECKSDDPNAYKAWGSAEYTLSSFSKDDPNEIK